MDGHVFDRCDVQGNFSAHNVPFRVQVKILIRFTGIDRKSRLLQVDRQ